MNVAVRRDQTLRRSQKRSEKTQTTQLKLYFSLKPSRVGTFRVVTMKDEGEVRVLAMIK